MSETMEEECLRKAEVYDGLGPNYFAARAIADRFMSAFSDEHFQPLAKKFADEFYQTVNETIVAFLLSDAESNLAGEMWRRIDASAVALLTGERWALEKYALTDKYRDGQKVREAVAKHIPREIMDGRIADLEKQVKDLTEDLKWARR